MCEVVIPSRLRRNMHLYTMSNKWPMEFSWSPTQLMLRRIEPVVGYASMQTSRLAEKVVVPHREFMSSRSASMVAINCMIRGASLTFAVNSDAVNLVDPLSFSWTIKSGEWYVRKTHFEC